MECGFYTAFDFVRKKRVNKIIIHHDFYEKNVSKVSIIKCYL